MAIRSAIEGLIITATGGFGVFVVGAMNMIEAGIDVYENGWTVGNAVQMALGAIPVIGVGARLARVAIGKAFGRFGKYLAAMGGMGRRFRFIPEPVVESRRLFRNWIKQYTDVRRVVQDDLLHEIVVLGREHGFHVRGPEIGTKGGVWSGVRHMHIGRWHVRCSETFSP